MRFPVGPLRRAARPDGPIDLVRRALRFVERGTRRRFALNIPLSVALAGFEFATMLLLVSFLSAATDGSDMADRFPWVVSLGVPSDQVALGIGAIVAVLFLLKAVLGACLMWWQSGVASRAEAARSVATFKNFLSASMRFHAESDTATGLRDIRRIPTMMMRSILVPATALVTDGLMFFALAALLVVSDPLGGVVALLYFALVSRLFFVLFGDRLRATNQRGQDLTRLSLIRLQDGIRGAEAIQSSQAERYFIDRFGETRDAWAITRHHAGFLNRAPRFYLEGALVLGISLICLVLFSTSDTADAFATVAVVVIVMFRLLPTLSRMVAGLNTMRGGLPALSRMEEVSALLEEASTSAATTERQTFSSHVALESVTVRFDDTVALDSVSLRIGRGERIALLGRSGAGKTTLVDVLLGLQSPDSGRVVMDGVEFTNERRQGSRDLVAYVPQDTFITDDSLAANVMLGRVDEDNQERLWDAIVGAGLEELVDELPDGLNTRLGDRGQLLSGGQRQRVGLARALYRKAALIVMDEATSALDNTTQKLVTDTIAALPDQVTVVTIAHRLNATYACDRVVVLEAGRIVADGPREEVLRATVVDDLLEDDSDDQLESSR